MSKSIGSDGEDTTVPRDLSMAKEDKEKMLQQRKQEAQIRRRKKKKTNSSLAATTFKVQWNPLSVIFLEQSQSDHMKLLILLCNL